MNDQLQAFFTCVGNKTKSDVEVFQKEYIFLFGKQRQPGNRLPGVPFCIQLTIVQCNEYLGFAIQGISTGVFSKNVYRHFHGGAGCPEIVWLVKNNGRNACIDLREVLPIVAEIIEQDDGHIFAGIIHEVGHKPETAAAVVTYRRPNKVSIHQP